MKNNKNNGDQIKIYIYIYKITHLYFERGKREKKNHYISTTSL